MMPTPQAKLNLRDILKEVTSSSPNIAPAPRDEGDDWWTQSNSSEYRYSLTLAITTFNIIKKLTHRFVSKSENKTAQNKLRLQELMKESLMKASACGASHSVSVFPWIRSPPTNKHPGADVTIVLL